MTEMGPCARICLAKNHRELSLRCPHKLTEALSQRASHVTFPYKSIIAAPPGRAEQMMSPSIVTTQSPLPHTTPPWPSKIAVPSLYREQ